MWICKIKFHRGMEFKFASEWIEDKWYIRWYGSVYSNIRNKFYMDGRTPQEVVDALIREYHF